MPWTRRWWPRHCCRSDACRSSFVSEQGIIMNGEHGTNLVSSYTYLHNEHVSRIKFCDWFTNWSDEESDTETSLRKPEFEAATNTYSRTSQHPCKGRMEGHIIRQGKTRQPTQDVVAEWAWLSTGTCCVHVQEKKRERSVETCELVLSSWRTRDIKRIQALDFGENHLNFGTINQNHSRRGLMSEQLRYYLSQSEIGLCRVLEDPKLVFAHRAIRMRIS